MFIKIPAYRQSILFILCLLCLHGIAAPSDTSTAPEQNYPATHPATIGEQKTSYQPVIAPEDEYEEEEEEEEAMAPLTRWQKMQLAAKGIWMMGVKPFWRKHKKKIIGAGAGLATLLTAYLMYRRYNRIPRNLEALKKHVKDAIGADKKAAAQPQQAAS